MSVYVGRWDCNRCGHQGILGPKTECPNCGSDRPKEVQFYVAEAPKAVREDSIVQQAKAGVDWRCAYCGQNNAATTTICKDCGHTRAETDATLAVRDYYTGDVPTTGKKKRREELATAPPLRKKLLNKKGCGIIALIALVVVGLIVYLGRSKEIVVTVEGFRWERQIATEQERLVEEEAWSLPSQGTLIRSFRDIHHYDKILSHYETRTRSKQRATGTEQYVCGKRDLGNGYFEDKYCDRTIYETYEENYEEPVYRQEPVYRTKYRYSIYRWQKAPPLTAQGQDHDPQWPNTNAVDQDPRRRPTQKTGTYSITVRDEKGAQHEHALSFEQWQALEKGRELKAKRGASTGEYRGLSEEYNLPS